MVTVLLARPAMRLPHRKAIYGLHRGYAAANDTVCGLPPPLSLTKMPPTPPASIRQLTVSVQDCPEPTERGQAFPREKSQGFETEMSVMSRGVLPTLVRVLVPDVLQ